MPLVTTTEMFKKAYEGGYAIGAFNVNNMEIVQGITEACQEQKAPVILQVSKGARAYANHTYLVKMVEAAVQECPDIPIALHLDHGGDFEICKSCIDGGFTSVMFDGSHMDYEDNVFFDILAEDLARRDMDDVPIDDSNYDELASRIEAYISEFERNGTDNIQVNSDIV